MLLDTGEETMSHRYGTCTKCGSGDVGIKHSRPSLTGHVWSQHPDLHERQDEHLDSKCRTCGFEWEGDCMDAKLKVESAWRSWRSGCWLQTWPVPTCPDCGSVRNLAHRDGCLHQAIADVGDDTGGSNR